MSLVEPKYASEADWLYGPRELMVAEMLLDAAAGRLVSADLAFGIYVALPPATISQQELDKARGLPIDSGLWIEDGAHRPLLKTKVSEVERQLGRAAPFPSVVYDLASHRLQMAS